MRSSYSRRVADGEPRGPTAGAAEQERDAPITGRNLYDLLTVVAALAFLLAITVFLVRHYGGDASQAGSILGILVPAVGAIFGVTIAYQTGAAKGKATGRQAGRTEAKQMLEPKLRALDDQVSAMVSTIRREGESTRGLDAVHVSDWNVRDSDLADVQATVQAARSYLDAM